MSEKFKKLIDLLRLSGFFRIIPLLFLIIALSFTAVKAQGVLEDKTKTSINNTAPWNANDLNPLLPQIKQSRLSDKTYTYFPVQGDKSGMQKMQLPEAFQPSDGYIIEFKNESKSVHTDNLKGQGKKGLELNSMVSDYKSQLSQEHELAKKDILSKINKRNFVRYTKSTKQNIKEDSLVVFGEYTTAFNGIALGINKSEAEKIQQLPFVKKVYTDNIVNASLYQSVPLINADDVWNIKDTQGRQITGNGIKVAVIDTGVDYTHPDLGGSQVTDRPFDIVTPDPLTSYWGSNNIDSTLANDSGRIAYFSDTTIYVYSFIDKTYTEIPFTDLHVERLAFKDKYIAFYALDINSIHNLYLYNLETRENKEIAKNIQVGIGGLAIQNSKVIFENAVNGNNNIYIYDIATQLTIPINQPSDLYTKLPSVSDNKIAYSVPGTFCFDKLVIYDTVTQQSKDYIPPDVGPVLDFKGNTVLYVACSKTNFDFSWSTYYLYDITTGQATKLNYYAQTSTTNNYSTQDMLVGPFSHINKGLIGDRVIFFSKDGNANQIIAYDLNSKKYAAINLYISSGAISGEGKKVCFMGKDNKIYCHTYDPNYDYSSQKSIWNNKVVGGYDFVNNDSDPMDDMGHGTHVASIIAAKDSTSSIQSSPVIYGGGPIPTGIPVVPTPTPTVTPTTPLNGVAPDAKIIAYKVLDQSGSGYTSWIMNAIDTAVQTKFDSDPANDIDVINMSLGIDCKVYFGGFTDNCGPDDPMSLTIDHAVNSGIVAVVAAGNSGEWGVGTIGSPGTARNAITVGAMDKYNNPAYFSSQGPVVWNKMSIIKPDLSAPGVDICAAEWGSWLSSLQCVDGKHIAISGTSMATPHVAGAAALIKQIHPEWNTDQIKTFLKSTSVNFGSSVISYGAGRLDLQKAINTSYSPFIVRLDPISISGQTRIISGTIQTGKFKSWSLAYAPSNVSPNHAAWITLTGSTQFPSSNTLYELNTNTIPDGEYTIRLLVEDTDGEKAVDYGYINIDKVKLTSPLNDDILKAGDNLMIEYSINSSVVSPQIKVEYGIGTDPSSWVSIPNSTNSSVLWNTSGLLSGTYVIRMSVSHDGISESDSARVSLDTSLKSGWPVRIYPDKDSGGYYWPGYTAPVTSDINNDGKEEMIVYAGGIPPKLYVYNHDGTLLWTRNVGNVLVRGGNLIMPVVDDINNDGKKEIIVYTTVPYSLSGYPEIISVYAFDALGNVVTGWPVNLETWYPRPSITIADVNNDNKKEVIIQADYGESNTSKMIILKSDGTILSQWNLSTISAMSYALSTPAVGNFDTDPDLEIVVTRPSENSKYNFITGSYNYEGDIHVFNWDGSEVTGWPVKVPGMIFSSPAVGDINKDGQPEIVTGLATYDIFMDLRYGGLYVFDKYGKILPGWPAMKGYSYYASPALGDVNGDGYLEIGISKTINQIDFLTEIYKYDGAILSGWPKTTSKPNRFSPVMGDITGDKKADMVISSGNNVYAWTGTGDMVSGFVKYTERYVDAPDAPGPALITDIDRNGKIDIASSSDYDYDYIKDDYKYRNSIYIWELPTAYDQSEMDWPAYHHDNARTGYLQPMDTTPLGQFKGEYWTNVSSFSTYPASAPTVTRTDAKVNFDWGAGSPDPKISTDKFIARWTKQEALQAGTYTFSVRVDDGVRLYVDGKNILDKWINQGPTSYTVDYVIPTGTHTITMDYYENEGEAMAKLGYYLNGTVLTSAYRAEYFTNVSSFEFPIGAPKYVRSDTSINFNWGTGSPNWSISKDKFMARWTKKATFSTSKTYKFTTTTDDGVRLFIDGEKILDKWSTPGLYSYTVSKYLTSGTHVIMMEYYENTGNAVAKMSYN